MMQILVIRKFILLSQYTILLSMLALIKLNGANLPQNKEAELIINSPIQGEASVSITGSLDKAIERAKHYPIDTYEIGRYYLFTQGQSSALADSYFKKAIELMFKTLDNNCYPLIKSGKLNVSELGNSSHWAYFGVLSEMYWYGRGVARDTQKAVIYMRLSFMFNPDDNFRSLIWREDDGRLIYYNSLRQNDKNAIDAMGLRILEHYSPEPKGSGTAFSFARGGYLITAYHVVEKAKRICVADVDSNSGEIISRDWASFVIGSRELDYAVIKIEGLDNDSTNRAAGPTIALGHSSFIKMGDAISTLGYPNIDLQGLSVKYTKGEVSSIYGFRDEKFTWQISIPVQPGNSGGPILNQANQAVGIIVAGLGIEAAKLTGSIPQNVNYALKMDYVLEDLKRQGSSIRPHTRIINYGLELAKEEALELPTRSVFLILTY